MPDGLQGTGAMSDPTQMIPTEGDPDGPRPRRDPRRVAMIVLAVVIGILLILLIVVSINDDGDSDTSAGATTTSTETSTTTTTTTASTTSTTEVEATTSSTTVTTSPSTTTTTSPPATIAPERCTGATGPTEPEPVAVVFYDAWRVGDTGCAVEVATKSAVDTLFANDGTGATWQFQGCSTFEDPEPTVDCAYTYEGGSSHFEMQYDAVDGWQIVAVEFVAD